MTAPANNEQLLYTIDELQEVLGVGRNLAYRLARKRGFPKIVINGRFYFPADKVKKWVDDSTGRSVNV